VRQKIAGKKGQDGEKQKSRRDSEKVIHPWSKSAGEASVLWTLLPDFRNRT
jgi:hypothetical protein